MSFGFKHGIPVEADLVFDVRFLPNPYFDPALRDLRGTDEAVRAFVCNDPEAKLFLEHMLRLLAFVLPLYEREGKRHLTLALGCTGGHHRSVALAEALCAALPGAGFGAKVFHRDIAR